MKKKFSTSWKSSKNVAKQRKYRLNAPLHLKQKFLSVHLSKDLRAKYGTRAVTVRVGDKVKVLRGVFKGRENKVEKVNMKDSRVFVTGVERAKKDGSKSHIPLRPSNVMITELNLDDKKRKQKLEKTPKPKTTEKKTADKPAAKPAPKAEDAKAKSE